MIPMAARPPGTAALLGEASPVAERKVTALCVAWRPVSAGSSGDVLGLLEAGHVVL